MLRINPNFCRLESQYLFADIARKVAAFREEHPERRVISLGIGDVSRPLIPSVITALHKAVDEMGTAAGLSRATPSCARPSWRRTTPRVA